LPPKDDSQCSKSKAIQLFHCDYHDIAEVLSDNSVCLSVSVCCQKRILTFCLLKNDAVYSQGAWWRTIGNTIWALHKTHIWTPPKAWTTVSSIFSLLIFSNPGCRGRCLNKSYKNCYCDPG